MLKSLYHTTAVASVSVHRDHSPFDIEHDVTASQITRGGEGVLTYGNKDKQAYVQSIVVNIAIRTGSLPLQRSDAIVCSACLISLTWVIIETAPRPDPVYVVVAVLSRSDTVLFLFRLT